VRHLFEVNSEPHTDARSSVRLCVGLIRIGLLKYYRPVGLFGYIFLVSHESFTAYIILTSESTSGPGPLVGPEGIIKKAVNYS
jgi:hypothetical protein